MEDFKISHIEMTNMEAIRHNNEPTPLRISIQNAGIKPDCDLHNLNEFPDKIKRYQRLPVRTIYEEISLLDAFDDNDYDFPLVFKAQRKETTIDIPIKSTVLQLKNKTEPNFVHDKAICKNGKRNSESNKSKGITVKNNKIKEKNQPNLETFDQLKDCLNYNNEHKKLIQADTIINSCKKPSSGNLIHKLFAESFRTHTDGHLRTESSLNVEK